MRKGKRGSGEGNIRERSDGRWEARISVRSEDGRLRRRSLYGASRGEVQQLLVKALRDQQQGFSLAAHRLTVAAFLHEWLETTAKPSIKPRSHERFEQIIRLHIIPTLGSLRLEKLGHQHVQRLLNAKSEEGLAPQTVVHVRNVLRLALNHALKWNLVSRNVALHLDPPRIVRHEIKVLWPDDARRLLEAVKGARLEALYSVALALGLRRGEALGLKWVDLDLDAGRLTVLRSLQRVAGKLQLVETKTNSGRRTITLPQIALRALREHRRRQSQERLIAGSEWNDGGLVFTGYRGTPLEPMTLRRDFCRVLAKAGLPAMRLHDLRHSAASLMLTLGVPLKTIQEVLGHSSIGVTAGFYAHLGEQLKQQAADAMDAALDARK
jgi:integrase